MGLAAWANARADRLQHSEQRFLEIARALAMRPRFVLSMNPPPACSAAEIDNLGAMIAQMRRLGSACCWWSTTRISCSASRTR